MIHFTMTVKDIEGMFTVTILTVHSNAVDEDLDNWWQSSSLANIDTQSMTIDLEFGQVWT